MDAQTNAKLMLVYTNEEEDTKLNAVLNLRTILLHALFANNGLVHRNQT